jgi:transposase
VEEDAPQSRKKRDESAFEQARADIVELRKRAQAGEITLAYRDEAGFEQTHPNRSAWTPVGEQHRIEAGRGSHLNVMAALLSNGKVISAQLWDTMNSELFLGFLELLREQAASKPMTVIMNNVSIHHAKSIAPAVSMLEKQGITLYVLPAYSPELNRIETLWHLIKYSWMAVKQRSAEVLKTDVSYILDNFGSTYKTNF